MSGLHLESLFSCQTRQRADKPGLWEMAEIEAGKLDEGQLGMGLCIV